MSIASLAFVCVFLAIFVGAAVQGSVGLGLSLITVPVGAIVAPGTVPGVFIMAGLPLSMLVMTRERTSIDWRTVLPITLGRIPGAIAGTAVVAITTDRSIALAAGVIVLIGASATARAPHIRRGTAAAVVAGSIAGLTGTAAGIDGPPMALYLQSAPHRVLRATLAACFVIGTAVSIPPLAITGHIHPWQVKVAACLIPAVILGDFVANRFLIHHVAARSRTLVLVVATVAGMSAIIRTLWF